MPTLTALYIAQKTSLKIPQVTIVVWHDCEAYYYPPDLMYQQILTPNSTINVWW